MTMDKEKSRSQLIAELEQTRERIVRLKNSISGQQGKDESAVTLELNLSPGGHLCCTYRTEKEQRAVLAPYKKLEIALRESEKRYHSLIHNVPVGLYSNTPGTKGEFTMANPAIAEMFGYDSVEEFKQVSTADLYADPEDQEEFSRRLWQQGFVQGAELRLIRKNGETFWGAVTAMAYKDEEGRISHFLGFIEDITERKKAEEALQETVINYRRLFDTSPDAIALVDRDGRFLAANPAMSEKFGLSREELEGRYHHDVMPQELADTRIAKGREAIQEGGLIFFEDEINGRYLQNYFVPISFANGKETFQVIARDVTERKQIEQELKSRSQAMESSMDGIALLNEEEKYVYFNEAHIQIYGYDYANEMLGKSWRILYDEQELNRLERDIVPALRQSGKWRGEAKGMKKDGTKFPQEVSLSALEDGGIICVVRDITERKQAEEALRESEQRFQCAMEASRDGLWDWDLTTDKVYYSPAYAAILDYTSEEIPPWASFWVDHLHPEDREAALRANQDCIENRRERFEIEFRMLTKDGDIRWILGQGLAVARDENGRATRLVGTHSDITERKRSEEALRESERQLATLMDNLPGMAYRCLKDLNWTMLFVSEGCLELTGYHPSDLLENRRISYGDVIVSADADSVWDAVREGLEKSGRFEVVYRIVTAEGEEKHVWEQGTGIYEGQSLLFLEGFVTDITKRKKAEEELQAAYDKLDSVVELNADGIMVLDQQGNILFLNPTAAEMMGQGQEELLGKQFGYPLIPGSNTEIELLSTSGESRVVELRGRETEWNGQAALLVSFRDITERKRAEERIYYLAYYDELTGMPNRRLFYDRLRQVAARSEHFGDGGAVFLVDITKLRDVNDTLGQQSGDELVEEVARRISETVFEKETVARVSGGEFIVLSEEKSTAEKARNLGESILERIGWNLELSGRVIYPEVNMGFTIFPDWGKDPDILIKQADIALSEAKKSASRIQEYTGQEDWIAKKFHLEHDLKQALANEEFFLRYQSQVDLRTGRIVGLEALLRWNHPQRGVVSPGEFIPVLEQTGMIAFADAWVIHKVCKQSRSWQERGILVKTSVNLSAQELSNDAILEVVRPALEENGVLAENLEVEITETDLMDNVDRASHILQTLSSWGVKVALDDFGKGYSSLSYLQKFAINTIKIDKQFVDGLPENQDSVTMVQTIIAMAHNLGKMVLAEGVERRDQWNKLLELGCDYGQGFLWGRPQAPDALQLRESSS